MASVKKHGNSYVISAVSGYDANKKKRSESMTWTPPAGLTPSQIEIELKKVTSTFEKEVESRQAVTMKIFTQQTELLGKIDKLIDLQGWIAQLLLSINSNLVITNSEEPESDPGVKDDFPSENTRSYYVRWNEAPQIMGVKEVAKMLQVSEGKARAVMHGAGFPLISYSKGMGILTTDKDCFRRWLLDKLENNIGNKEPT